MSHFTFSLAFYGLQYRHYIQISYLMWRILQSYSSQQWSLSMNMLASFCSWLLITCSQNASTVSLLASILFQQTLLWLWSGSRDQPISLSSEALDTSPLCLLVCALQIVCFSLWHKEEAESKFRCGAAILNTQGAVAMETELHRGQERKCQRIYTLAVLNHIQCCSTLAAHPVTSGNTRVTHAESWGRRSD